MSAPTTFTTRSIASALGVKGGVQPKLAIDAIYPVAVYADFSHTLSAEAIEPRAIVGSRQNALVGNYNVWELHCRSSGGLVVENLVLSIDHGAVADNEVRWRFYISATALCPTPGLLLAQMNIGGIPVRSVCYTDHVPTGIFVPMEGLWPLSYLSTTEQIGLRLYVPSGAYFGIYNWIHGIETACAIHFREVVNALGPP